MLIKKVLMIKNVCENKSVMQLSFLNNANLERADLILLEAVSLNPVQRH